MSKTREVHFPPGERINGKSNQNYCPILEVSVEKSVRHSRREEGTKRVEGPVGRGKDLE